MEPIAEPTDPEVDEPREPLVDRLGWISFSGGFFAALLALQFWPTQAALGAMATLVHEMGHAAFGWLFGYPSIPAFDFSYGGGVTLQQERMPLLAAGVALALGYGVYALREWALLRNALLSLLVLYVPLALTRGHEAAILMMGHGGEVCFATLALHRALSGRGCQLEAERPLYALVGWFLVLAGMRFAWQLRTSDLHRELYESAKGGGHWMDFSRLADEFLHVPLETVAGFFLVALVAPPVLALAGQRLRRE
ncbi:hypothetical protein K2X89_15280 [Myxococcota bacterium]|nr:hypothetical protein [Myxococcota bacterium]